MNIETQSRALRQLAAQLVGGDAQADDLVQDAWVDALQNPPSRDRPAGPWLRTVLRNRRVTNLRAQIRRARREGEGLPPASPPSADQLQVARELLGHLASLSKADRDLLTLRYWEALTLNECAERLGISASTARSRHARALTKLRERLDTRTGGREAWLSALAPWLVHAPPPATAAAPSLSLASLSVGGVAAGACLWLLSGLNPGCSGEPDTATPDDAGREQLADVLSDTQSDAAAQAKPNPRAGAPNPATVGTHEVDFDAEKHPCDRPIAPEDAPSMAELLRSGEKLTADQHIAAIMECRKLHGPSGQWQAKNPNPDGSVHPLLSATMSIQHIWPAMRHCYTGSTPARIRLSFSFWLHEDGSMTVEDTKTLNSEGLDADEIACVERSISVAEVDLRNGDPTKMGLPAHSVLEIPRTMEVELADSKTEVIGTGFHPSGSVEFHDKAEFIREREKCGSGPLGATFHWDPESRELLEVEPDPSLDPKTAACLTELLEAQIKPRRTKFFPRTDADTRQHCTFEGEKHSCDVQPGYRLVER